jgi:hypothetical protein
MAFDLLGFTASYLRALAPLLWYCSNIVVPYVFCLLDLLSGLLLCGRFVSTYY